MSHRQNGTAPIVGSDRGRESNTTSNSHSAQVGGALKTELKWHRVLRRLLDGPLDRITAEKYPVSDHVLNSTVSELKKRGLIIHAQLIRKAGFSGEGAHVAQYTLANESRDKALQLLGTGR